MSIKITLNEDHHYIHGYYYDEVVLGDLQEFSTTILKFFNETTYETLHLVVDVNEVKYQSINVAKAWKSIMEAANHTKLGAVIVVGVSNISTKFLIELLAKLGKADLKTVSTHDEAITMLESLN